MTFRFSGAGERRLTEVSEANDRVKRAALGLTLHRQTICLFLAAGTASLSSTFNLTFVVTSLLETYAAAERIFKIEDSMPETEEPEQHPHRLRPDPENG